MLFAGQRGWMQLAPNRLASRTPFQPVAATGGFHRKLPTGGSAYGIPLNDRTPCASTRPTSIPCAMVTTGRSGEATARADKHPNRATGANAALARGLPGAAGAVIGIVRPREAAWAR